MDEILAYMHLMLRQAGSKHVPITKDSFRKHGRSIRFFPGLDDWFARVNAYGRDRDIRVEHYIISSGLREMIEGTSINREFEYVFASGFAYDPNNVATWPALAVMLDDDGGFGALPEMRVLIDRGGRKLGVPLDQLVGVDVNEATAEAIADWHYWVATGRQF